MAKKLFPRRTHQPNLYNVPSKKHKFITLPWLGIIAALEFVLLSLISTTGRSSFSNAGTVAGAQTSRVFSCPCASIYGTASRVEPWLGSIELHRGQVMETRFNRTREKSNGTNDREIFRNTLCTCVLLYLWNLFSPCKFRGLSKHGYKASPTSQRLPLQE